MMYNRDSRTVPSDLDAEVLEASVYPSEESEVFTHGKGAEMTLNAYIFPIWFRCSSKGVAPYSDLYLHMVLDIFDEQGIFVGTRY